MGCKNQEEQLWFCNGAKRKVGTAEFQVVDVIREEVGNKLYVIG